MTVLIVGPSSALQLMENETRFHRVMGRELTDVHMDKKSNGVVPNSNDASGDKVHVTPKISEDNVDAKD